MSEPFMMNGLFYQLHEDPVRPTEEGLSMFPAFMAYLQEHANDSEAGYEVGEL